MTGTTQELADFFGVDYQTANGLLRYLRAKNLIQEMKSRPAKGGKGKPATVYVLPQKVVLQFSEEVSDV